MIKTLLFAVASLAAVPAAAYVLPDRPIAASSVTPAKFLAGNLPSPEGFVVAPLAGANLVINGSFETADFSGWTQVNDLSFTFVTDELAGGGPTEGLYHAAFGPTDPGGGGIIQQIATTAGGVYTLSFDLANLGGTPNAFGLFWDGSFVSIDFDVPAFDYITFTTSLIASGTDTSLGFIFYHDPSFWLLDNVTLSAVPEPASWAMLIAGFGLTGAAMRRRRAVTAA
jgi:hypothetical protein